MTRPNKREYRFVPLLLAVFSLMPMAALAQTPDTQAAQERDILHDVALSFLANSGNFSENLEKARRMHAEVLGMRTVTEERYAYCARTQGHLAYLVGNLGEAQEAFEGAGVAALLRGDIHDAATSFLYAAHTAASRSRFYDAQLLVERATLLFELPLRYVDYMPERIALTHRLSDVVPT
jgi:catechol 2,3-dioxygenase-like lactoylglutathione lyase family enzyme